MFSVFEHTYDIISFKKGGRVKSNKKLKDDERIIMKQLYNSSDCTLWVNGLCLHNTKSSFKDQSHVKRIRVLKFLNIDDF